MSTAPNIDVRILVTGVERFREALYRCQLQVEQLNRIWEERAHVWAVTEGQWPDRFTLLNRYVRTGQEPPYLFND